LRRHFIAKLMELASRDERIVFLTADLGYTVVEPFAEAFPSRFYNVGVAEQNMIGMATGMAEDGLIPFVYSIIPFAVMRPFEFIRNGPALHGLAVRIVAVGGGFEYGSAGSTHYGLEDLALMRVLPGMKVLAPVDYGQACSALAKTWDLPGPVYYRLGKDDQFTISGLNGNFEIGELNILGEEGIAAIVSTGAIAREAVSARNLLSKKGYPVSLAFAPCLSPSPTRPLLEFFSGKSDIFTVESHYQNGGLGSLVCEIVAENKLPCRVHRIAVKDIPKGITGSERFLNEKNHLSGAHISDRISAVLGADFNGNKSGG